MVVTDEFTRRRLAIHVARRIRSKEALEVFADLMVKHGVPKHDRSDNGPEMVAERPLRLTQHPDQFLRTGHSGASSKSVRNLRR
jgi:hypothetical protein